ncbi:hypothetical protein CCAX7_15830 [Capsulimonas corticalis]|uniref:Uncharacterized protein n=1 Tax=Capsulimonas corticalis TaxID=2219043 RepID=A0A402CZ41_9BACT|nr:hypothetical protein [Capsulimonas corticalis]BDI29532.1 hypothetical protein CCAX7_15830 [Capsulimonas corticalis]
MTIALPAALASWAPHLNLFPDDLAAALAPLAQRLDAAIGPMRTHDRVDEGDPDGFSDIGRRGPYDRLLLSEWLLADDAPDEFLRRAAMGEHGFLQLARRTRTGGRVSFALFDAGPSQIGGPRIAHLALLIALARRAEAAKARFEWAIVQRPDMEPEVGLTESSIRALLLARSSQPPTSEMWHQWRERATAQSDVDDFWAIGGARLARLAARDGASGVEVRDELDPETHQISAHVHRAGRADAHVVLDLPADALCARLLRDPFATAVAAPTKPQAHVAPASNLLFTASGSKLIARAHDGGLIAYPVPNSPRSGPGYPKHYTAFPSHTKTTILAAGRIGKAYVIITRPGNGDALLVSCIGGKNAGVAVGAYPIDVGYQKALDDAVNPPLSPCFATPQSNPAGSRLVIGLPGNIRMPGRCSIATLYKDAKGAHLNPIYNGAVFLATLNTPHHILCGLQAKDGWSVALDGSERTPQNIPGATDDNSPGLFMGYASALGNERYGLVAAYKGDGYWSVLTNSAELSLKAIPECRVVGVIATRRYQTPALVLLEPGARRLRVLGASWSHVLPIADAPIEHVTVSHAAPIIAYSTTNGEVIIYSLEHEAILYRLAPGGGAS